MEAIKKTTAGKSPRKFDEAFKLEVVRNWQASGKPAAVVARELGLGESQLYAWRGLLPPTDAGGRAAVGGRKPGAPDLQLQLDAAHREIAHLREQRDILKKTLGILSEPVRSASPGCMR